MNRLFYLVAVIATISTSSSCKLLSGKNKSGGSLPNDGQLHGVAPASKWSLPKPLGMVYIPPGTFHMGSSDEDLSYAFTARNKQVSISGFWMDATEITNNEYRQFTNWVRDSIAAKLMGYIKVGADGNEYVDWQKMRTLKWNDPKVLEALGQTKLILPPDDRLFGKMELDPKQMIFLSKTFDLKDASTRAEYEAIMKVLVSIGPATGCTPKGPEELVISQGSVLADIFPSSVNKTDRLTTFLNSRRLPGQE